MYSYCPAVSPSYVYLQQKYPFLIGWQNGIHLNEACQGFEPELPVYFRTWTWTAGNNMLVDWGKNNVTSCRLTKYVLLPHYLDSLVLSFALTDVDANGYIIRLAWQPTVSLVGEKKIYIYMILNLPVTVDENWYPLNDCVVSRSPGLTFSHTSYRSVCRVV